MDNNSEVVYLYLDDIIPNRFQPREVFDDQSLKELAVSIKEHGVIHPIIVRKVENKYEIIAGERRYKAATMAGLTKIPAMVKNLDDKESSKVALIENLQRRDLTPIEEARTYQKILELEDGMTQEQLAATMGKTQSSVSNKLRLLSLPEEIQDALLKEKLSERHARSLLNIEDKNEQIKLMERVVTDKMTVRDLEKLIREMKDGPLEEVANEEPAKEENTQKVTDFNSLMNSVSSSSNVTVDNNSLSASDILNEEKQEETAPASVELSPTEVDINKIRENAVDIGGPKPELVPETEPATEADGFKFVPTFGKNFVTSNTAPAPSKEENNFSRYFDPTSSNGAPKEEPKETQPAAEPVAETPAPVEAPAPTPAEVQAPTPEPAPVEAPATTPVAVQPEATNVASSISTPAVTVSGDGKDVTAAVDNIKTLDEDLKKAGYSVSMRQIDNSINCLVTIVIKKKA